MASDSKGTSSAKQRSSRRVTWPLRNRPAGSPHPRTLDNLKANLGQVSTVAVQRLSTSLPWFSQLRADERSELGLLAQRGISSFVRWYEDPQEPVWVLTEVFKQAPTELTRSISLQNALQVLRIVVDVVEDADGATAMLVLSMDVPTTSTVQLARRMSFALILCDGSN